jgi:hypothetical protein
MGKRGPAAKGEYRDKSRVLSTRISEELREALEVAAEGNKTTLSREIEHRLRRTFIEDKQIDAIFGSRRMFQLMRLIASVIDSTVNRKVFAKADKPKKQNVDWLDDPYAFDQAMRVIATVLGEIRPPGAVPQSPDEALDQYEGTFQGAFNAIETLRDVQKAPDALLLTGSRHQKNMADIKQDIGDLADRALVHGRSADETRKLSELGKKLATLRNKQAKVGSFDALSIEDREQMNAIVGEIEQLQRGGGQ